MKFFCFLLGLITWCNLSANNSEKIVKRPTIEWITPNEMDLKQKKEPRKVLFFIYTDWCGWCKKMEKEVYLEKEIVQFINANFYAVKFNAEDKKPVQFNDKTYQYLPAGRRRGIHQLATSLLKGRVSFPSTVFLNKKLEPISVVQGFQNSTVMKQVLASINTLEPTK